MPVALGQHGAWSTEVQLNLYFTCLRGTNMAYSPHFGTCRKSHF